MLKIVQLYFQKKRKPSFNPIQNKLSNNQSKYLILINPDTIHLEVDTRTETFTILTRT